MIQCKHCEALNQNGTACCTQCGAPLGKDRSFGIAEEVAAVQVEPYVYGIDVSAWNGTMDWNVTKDHATYAFIRAGYGNGIKDPRVDTYRNDIVATPMAFGLYWYVKVGQHWGTHARAFRDIWRAGPGKLPPVMDLEYTILNPLETTAWIYNLLREFENLAGVKSMIYTSPGWWNSHTVANPWQKDYQLWDAHWTAAPQPIIPRGWTTFKHWQYSADNNGLGRMYGSIDGDKDMDLDKYNGTLAQFNAEYGTNQTPIPPPPGIIPVEPIKYVVVNTSALNLRALPSAQSADIGTLKYGDDVGVIEEVPGWYKISGWIYSSFTKAK